MSVLNWYALNWAYLDGSMLEGYNTEEVIECCQEYLKDNRGIGLPDSHRKGRLVGKGSKGKQVFIDNDFKEVSQAHYSVLQSVEVMQPYINEHLDIIREESNGHTEDWVMRQHKHQLTTWLREHDI